jgi:hypothetical protein
MILFALDPGNIHTGYVVYDTESRNILEFGKIENEEMREKLIQNEHEASYLAIEMIASYGMAVGKSVFDTCVWTGRFIEAWGQDYEQVYRRATKMVLCGSAKATDSAIRQALIDIFEPDLEPKKRPKGPLKGISKDVWQALGIAIVYERFEKFPALRKDYGS